MHKTVTYRAVEKAKPSTWLMWHWAEVIDKVLPIISIFHCEFQATTQQALGPFCGMYSDSGENKSTDPMRITAMPGMLRPQSYQPSSHHEITISRCYSPNFNRFDSACLGWGYSLIQWWCFYGVLSILCSIEYFPPLLLLHHPMQQPTATQQRYAE